MKAPTVALALAAAIAAGLPAAAHGANLRAGVGKADITPQTGYVLGGWTRADRTGGGQHTRLFSRALVLERDGRKLALAQVDLFMVPAGLVRHVGEALKARGLSDRNIIISASHTHSGPGGFANFPTLNTTAPSLQTVTDPASFFGLLAPGPADPRLYTFLVRQISAAIRRADEDLAPAAAGWGRERLLGLTRNRSLEAHLANHGIERPYGEGETGDDPGGYEHTIDPDVDVLRVDKLVRRRAGRKRKRRTVRVPIGAWSVFADHGTVTHSSFPFYNADHHASAMRVFEARVRKLGKVPRGQEVINVYGNGNEGDMSAGLDRHGPAESDYVGRAEANAMLVAWRRAGRRLSRRPALDHRWTRFCYCGQSVAGGSVGTASQVGIPFLTGSEEERGPLFDITQKHFEGLRSPVDSGPHGRKLSFPGVGGGVPVGVPLVAARVGDRAIVSLPAEGTKEAGARIDAAVASAVAGSGIKRSVISGLANEFLLYMTTPEEYDRQHYEGGNTQFGRLSAVLMQNEIAKLAGTLARGAPAPPAFAFDPTNGVVPGGPGYPSGAASASVRSQPRATYGRLEQATFGWQGGTLGNDRPLERAFVTAQRRDRGRWRRFDDDLGLAMLWTVDAAGRYRVRWEIPRNAPRGTYRLRVTAKRYTLSSRGFAVAGSGAIKVVPVNSPPGRVAVSLEYPGAVTDRDLTFRPQLATGGSVRFRVDGRTVTVRRRRATVFSVPARPGARVTVPVAAAKDRFGNVNGRALSAR